MKITKQNNKWERLILIAMIVDKTVLAKITAKWTLPMFRSKWADIVGGWCVKYFTKYETPPLAHIENIFESWSSKDRNKELIEPLEKFLTGLSGEYEAHKEEINSAYIIDAAGQYFNEIRLERLSESIQGELELGELEKARTVVDTFHHLEMGGGEGIDVFNNMEAMRQAFEYSTEPLVQYPGDLGKFFNNALCRDAFVSFLAPEKRGKCVSGDMEVPLEDGSVEKIEDIVKKKIQKRILTYNEKRKRFEYHHIQKYWDNGLKECVKVKTKSGRWVETTTNHQYLTVNGWRYLEDIRIGEYIAVPKNIPCFGTEQVLEDEIKFVAYMLADGGCTCTQMTFTKTDAEICKDFEQVCTNLNIEFTRKDITYHLKGASNPICRKYGLYGKTSKTKTIPKQFFKLEKEKLSTLLKLFFTCDGSIYLDKGKNKIELTLANEKLLRQTNHLLLRFCVIGKIKKTKASFNGQVFDSWRLVINSREYVNRYLEIINFDTYKKREPEKTFVLKSFLDKFPYEIAQRFYDELIEEVKEPVALKYNRGQYYRKISGFCKLFGEQSAKHLYEQLRKNKPVMRQTFIKAKGTNTYEKYMNDDILWDEVTEIKCMGEKHTYDLSVLQHHNFICNDVLVHNTHWLIDVSFRAVSQRKKVAFFAAGDMTEHQMIKRIAVRLCRQPLKPQKIMYPIDLEIDEETDKASVTHKVKVFTERLDWRTAWKACEEFKQKQTKTKKSLFKMSCHPNSSLSVNGIKSILQMWEREDWTPDIIVIDYADILNMDYPGLEGRERINETWKQLRALSQSYHCLVLTATQSNAASYSTSLIDLTNFSEDKRKFAHVTGMVGINQTTDERQNGVMRLNWIVLREEEFNVQRCVYTAGNLGIGNPAIKNLFAF